MGVWFCDLERWLRSPLGVLQPRPPGPLPGDSPSPVSGVGVLQGSSRGNGNSSGCREGVDVPTVAQNWGTCSNSAWLPTSPGILRFCLSPLGEASQSAGTDFADPTGSRMRVAVGCPALDTREPVELRGPSFPAPNLH